MKGGFLGEAVQIAINPCNRAGERVNDLDQPVSRIVGIAGGGRIHLSDLCATGQSIIGNAGDRPLRSVTFNEMSCRVEGKLRGTTANNRIGLYSIHFKYHIRKKSGKIPNFINKLKIIIIPRGTPNIIHP